ncbi:HDIG domain-containing protein [Desulfonema ishimotonii]|uniref:HDIG domain-containing protein n=2 Tax=Desulfonema ishimotonii TaxID=45657 RepID=A0A401G4A3_9BACT|nr:HDIG domain-containing protein [Desulfonema ishimotonii]
MSEQGKEKILFVDDEENLLDIASEYFHARGYHVITAKNGAEALEIFKHHKVDCCLTDINMPEMNGLELAEQIRMIDNTIPVVVMTGYPSLDNTIQTLKNGVVDFLIKPINLNQMELSIQSVLRERRLFVDNLFLKQEVEKKAQLEKLNRELHSKIEELQILTKIMEDFTAIRRSADVFQRLVDMTVEIAAADGACFYVANSSVQEPFRISSAIGDLPGVFYPENVVGQSLFTLQRVMDVAMGRIEGPLMITEKEDGGRLPAGVGSFAAVPLSIREKVFGVLTASVRKNGKRITDKTLYYLSFMAHKAAYAIENLALYENIYENLIATLDALVQAIEARDFYTKKHSKQVTEIAIAIAKQMECCQEDIEILEVAGPLHDIGKIGIPDSILLKPGRLTDAEYKVIKTHPVIGADIVGQLGLWDRERLIIRHHHERFDGTGYPDGLSGEAIPLLARILSVADVFDAMASNRVYRKKMAEQVVMDTIHNGGGTQFDPDVVSAFRCLHASGSLPEGRAASQ